MVIKLITNRITINYSENGDPALNRGTQFEDLRPDSQVNTRFNNWISRRITDYKFIENIEFIAIAQKRALGHGRGKIDYHLTVDEFHSSMTEVLESSTSV